MELSELAVTIASKRPIVALVSRLARHGMLSQGPSGRRAIALTFDDGPDATWTPRVLDRLDELGAKATFFVVGRNVANYPEIVRETRARGHEIGTHLTTHTRAVAHDDAAFARELRASLTQLGDLLGEPVRWLRFPHGDVGAQRPRKVLAAFGVEAVHWTFSGHDGFASAPEVVTRVACGLRPGAIVLLHDCLADGATVPPPYVASREATVRALPGILATARARGLEAVTLSALVAPAG
jgi:peptidoglycan/xylan/chitin deacetylase (PgdA/CDA1 family)